MSLSIDQLRALINEGEASDPLVLLECVAQGNDPRRTSLIYDKIQEIKDFNDPGGINPLDWAEVVDLVEEFYRYEAVSLDHSMAAAKELANYLHAKRKQVEMSEAGKTDDVSAAPLTEGEIQLFKEVFNDEF